MSTATALRSTSEPQHPRALKTASREIFAKRGSASRHQRAYAFVASRENAYAYEKVRQDRQSLQTDPVGYGSDFNLYAYVQNDPTNLADPSGLQTCASRIQMEDQDDSGASSCSVSMMGEGNSATQQTESNRPQINAQAQNDSDDNCSWSPEQCAALADQAAISNVLFPQLVDIVTSATAANAAYHCAVDGQCSPVDFLPWARLGRIGRAVGRATDCCFVGGTLVDTQTGLRPIEDIRVGDLVLSQDEATGAIGYKPVIDVVPGHLRELWNVTVSVPGNDESVTFGTTSEHPWRTGEGEWVPTAGLRQGMRITRADGPPAVVLEVRNTRELAETYNLEIAEWHTYFVGEQRLWVHNECPWFNPNFVPSRLRQQIFDTLADINAGARGSAFRNWHGRLPPGSYTRHTVGDRSGPTRIVTSSDGRRYITFDHYQTFQRIR